MEELKRMCAEMLSDELSVESAAETLILADIYGLQVLKEEAYTFINANKIEVMVRQGWKNVLNCPQLRAEAYEWFVVKNKQLNKRNC